MRRNVSKGSPPPLWPSLTERLVRRIGALALAAATAASASRLASSDAPPVDQILRHPFGPGDVETPAGFPDEDSIAERSALAALLDLDVVHAGRRCPIEHPAQPGDAL